MTTNVQEEDGVLAVVLQMLKEECEKSDPSLSQQAFGTAVLTMLKILRNAQRNPSEEKFRRIRLENAAFAQKVWQYDGCQQFLQASGWVIVDDTIVLTDETGLEQAIKELEQHLSPPSTSGGVESDVHDSKKKEINEARQKQLEKMKKEKEDRKRIAEQIKADRQETNTREHRDSRSQQRRFGAQIKRFKDIGIDLNSGGG